MADYLKEILVLANIAEIVDGAILGLYLASEVAGDVDDHFYIFEFQLNKFLINITATQHKALRSRRYQ